MMDYRTWISGVLALASAWYVVHGIDKLIDEDFKARVGVVPPMRVRHAYDILLENPSPFSINT